MTRQQEGDEAAVKAVYPDAKIGRDHHSAYYAFTKNGAGGRISDYVGSEALAWTDARSKLPATVQPEDEATLPAMEITDEDRRNAADISFTTAVTSGYPMPARKYIVCRERQLLGALRERDALKAERDELNANLEIAESSLALEEKVHAACDERLLSLKAQLDAVVGQETVAEAFVRGQRVMALKFAVLPAGPMRKTINLAPYTPPLKAGQ